LVSGQTQIVYDSDAPRRPLIDEFSNFWQQRALIRLLVTSDLTVRYKRSILGVWWTLLGPFLTTLVMWMVFSQIFRRSGQDVPFIVYLLSGVLLISTFFSQGVLATGASLVSSGGILSKMRVPGEIFAATAAVAAAVNFLIGLIPLAFVMAFTRTPFKWTWVLIPIPTFFMLLLVIGLGMLVAAAAVHWYDVLEFVRIIIMLSVWLVPTFYPLDIIPEWALPIVKANPLYSYLVVFRFYVYGGGLIEPWHYAMMVGSALALLVLGVWVFSRSWRNLVVKL
jgi:ABC-type polysaccharide/polyol phosphate export permease